MVAENLDPNLSLVVDEDVVDGASSSSFSGKKPPSHPDHHHQRSKKNKKKGSGLRVSISPKKPTTYLVSPGGAGGTSSSTRARRNRRRSSSHFGGSKKKTKKKAPVYRDSSDDEEDDVDDDVDDDEDEEDSDIEFTLAGAADVGGAEEEKGEASSSSSPFVAPGTKKKAADGNKKRRRRRSSARFLRLSAGGGGGGGDGGDEDDDADARAGGGGAGDFASSEHLGEIYKRAIRMNAENKINAGNSWGLKLIENMDKFIVEDEHSPTNTSGLGGGVGNEEGAREELKAARKMRSKDDRGRVNFTKASCTLDASVKIYSYRVDDVHLSSYRVLANLNRTDNKKDNQAIGADGDVAGEEGEGSEKAVKRRTGPRGPTETLESNLANINMSKLDSAYDIDPLFHKMSKSFDEGGAKGLLLGNLGVSQNGCHIVFDSKDEGCAGGGGANKLDDIEEEEKHEDGNDDDNVEDKEDDEENEFDIDPEEAVVWKESEIDITSLASKLASMLSSYGHRTSSSVPFVPQLESLREDYAALEEEGFAVDERDAASEGRKRLKLYDAPEEEEKEAEKSIHVIAMERSRGSVLGMSFDTNFRLSMGDLGDDDDDNDPGGEFGTEDFGGEGEFAPAADDDGGGFDGAGDFAPDFGGDDGGFEIGGDDFRPSEGGILADARSYGNTKVLLDALCEGDAFYEGAGVGGNGDYAFFDMKKFERATDGNLWAGSQHWKKRPALTKGGGKDDKKKRVAFDDDGEEEKKVKRKTVKKDRVFINFMEAPDVDAIFEKKKTTRRTKRSKKDVHQMPQTEKDYLLPPDADVDISQLSRLFSRPNAVVRRVGENTRTIGKTVGFYDVEENALGFNDGDDDDFGGDDDGGGFAFAYGEDDLPGGGGDGADYDTQNFDEVRKVEKIDITYATVAKKVDVRRLKRDLWAELEDRTTPTPPESFPNENEESAAINNEEDDENKKEEEEEDRKVESRCASFKETVEKMDVAQSQNDVTVSFYFICCLHLANEKGLKLEMDGLEDFVISVDDGSAPTFGTFGDGFSQTANKLSDTETSTVESRGKRRTKKVASYMEEVGDDEDDASAKEE